MEMEVQKFLRGTFDDPLMALQGAPYYIGVQHSMSEPLVLLNYHHIDSPPGDPICDECRGLILDTDTWNVVSRSFRRFYNLGDPHAAKIDWENAELTSKVDGSLVVFYNYRRKWRFQTRGNISAEGTVPAGRWTFSERVLGLFDRHGLTVEDVLGGLPENHCVVCEYVGPYNRIVTPYEEEDLYLLDIIDKDTGVGVATMGISWPFSIVAGISSWDHTPEGVLSMARELPKLSEGFVVCDAWDQRVKVKNPAYLALYHLVGAGSVCTDKHLATVVLIGEIDEVTTYFPELARRIREIQFGLHRICGEAEKLWEENKDAPNRKLFAMGVKDHPMSAWLFGRLDGKVPEDPKAWARKKMSPEKLLDAIR